MGIVLVRHWSAAACVNYELTVRRAAHYTYCGEYWSTDTRAVLHFFNGLCELVEDKRKPVQRVAAPACVSDVLV